MTDALLGHIVLHHLRRRAPGQGSPRGDTSARCTISWVVPQLTPRGCDMRRGEWFSFDGLLAAIFVVTGISFGLYFVGALAVFFGQLAMIPWTLLMRFFSGSS